MPSCRFFGPQTYYTSQFFCEKHNWHQQRSHFFGLTKFHDISRFSRCTLIFSGFTGFPGRVGTLHQRLRSWGTELLRSLPSARACILGLVLDMWAVGRCGWENSSRLYKGSSFFSRFPSLIFNSYMKTLSAWNKTIEEFCRSLPLRDLKHEDCVISRQDRTNSP